MSIGSINSAVATTAVASTPITSVHTQSIVADKGNDTVSSAKTTDGTQANSNSSTTSDSSKSGSTTKSLSESDLKAVTGELNNFMQSMSTDISFVLHSKTNTLMIEVKDSKNRVIKEFPAHELLDMVARLRDNVGALVDKQA